MQSITYSTRKASRLIGVEPHVLYSNYRRHGHYRGLKPRKGRAGRLYWPADAVQALALPPESEWPEGIAQWLGFVAMVSGSTDLDRVAAYWLGVALKDAGVLPDYAAEAKDGKSYALLYQMALLNGMVNTGARGNERVSTSLDRQSSMFDDGLQVSVVQPRPVSQGEGVDL